MSASDKVALVTGGSSGIGASAAVELQDKGFLVYAVARRVERLADLQSRGVNTFAMDVTDDPSMVSGVDRVLDELGRIDVLVNNAGYGSYGALEDVSLDEARRQFEVNVFGLARLTQLVIPTMREQGSGRIINVSSVGGRFYEPFGAWYHATKFAVEGLSDSLRMELKPFGIHVVVIQPAAIVTEWNTIARDSLLEQSGDTAYGSYVKRAHQVMAAADRPGSMMANTPDVVGRKIARAATVRRPAARYPVGRGARAVTTGRDLLPDAVFDQIVSRTYGSR